MVIKGLMDFDSSWYLCVLELLTKTQTKFKPYQYTRNQRTLNSWTNSEVQKVSSECWSERSDDIRICTSESVFRSTTSEASLQKPHFRSTTSEASLQKHYFRRAFRSKLRIIKNVKNMQGTCDMDICPGKYTCMNQSTIKAWTRNYVKKVFNVHSRLWTLKH